VIIRATELTGHGWMAPPAKKPLPPLHTAREIAPLLAFIGRPELAERLGIPAEVLDDPRGLVPLPLVLDLFEAAVEASGDAYLGLHFGVAAGRVMRGRATPLFHLMLRSPDLRTGFGHLLRHQRLWNQGDRYELEELGSSALLRYVPWGPPRGGQVQVSEKTVAQFFGMLRVFARVEPEQIRLAHPRRAGSEEVERVLGLAPRFDAPATEVVFPASALARPLRSAEPALLDVLERHVDELAQRAENGTRMEGRVREQILADLAGGQVSVYALAARLGCSERTLQRQLRDEGTSIREILDSVRRARAESLLETNTPIAEIARLLGYSQRAALHHAFRRWFGTSPGRLRSDRLR
jgi:AraC-like DNA-binding protein